MAVHFKFRSAVNFDSIDVEGNGITLGNLKDKIVQQKNLGRSTNFDLVVTNAESGEEYFDDAFLVPKNTSVIIKRVPAKLAKTTLLVHDREDNGSGQQPSRSRTKDIDVAQLALTSPVEELYDMDDFGVDLYAVDESALTHLEPDELSNASALVAKSVTDGKRLSQESLSVGQAYGTDAKGFARGLGHGKAVPHAGYVCHRCGQPGHFIQHCPTNGDPSYDLKKVSRPRADREDLSALAAMNNFFSKEVDPLPPELRCSLCQGIFKEAVMIPCCQYSFCDTCVREYLLEKGLCPQCGSEKSKNSDLLPNVALRQAIDRFSNAQLDTPIPNDGADVESATKAKNVPSPPTQLRKTSSTAKDLTSVVMGNKQSDLPTVDDSVCESAIGSKERNVLEGCKTGGLTGDGIFVGKKKKRLTTRPGSISDIVAEHMNVKPRKANRFCFVCGSPDHIARNCTGNGGESSVSFPAQRTMFHPVGPVTPRAIAPFGQDMYWPGQPVVHVRPLPLSYGEGMYGPMPYGAAGLPVGPYGVSSYTPSIYPNPSVHGFLNGVGPRMMAPSERPLSREEFMELQERERRRRLMQERQERELSEENPTSAAGNEHSTSGSEHSLQRKWPAVPKSHENSWRHDIDSNIPKETGSIKSRQKHSRKLVRSDEHMAAHRHNDASDNDSAFDNSRALSLNTQKLQRGFKAISTVSRKSSKMYDCSVSEKVNVDWEEAQNARTRSLKEEGYVKLGKQSSLMRYDTVPFEKREHNTYVKHDGTRVSDAGAAELLHSSRHRTKKAALDGAKALYADPHAKLAAETKDRHLHHHHTLLPNDGGNMDGERKLSGRKHHSQAKIEAVDKISGDELKKKRKHQKHRLEGVNDTHVESGALKGVSRKLSRKKHKSSHNSAQVIDKTSFEDFLPSDALPVGGDVQERWQMDDGLGDDDNIGLQQEMSRRKRRRSLKSAP